MRFKRCLITLIDEEAAKVYKNLIKWLSKIIYKKHRLASSRKTQLDAID